MNRFLLGLGVSLWVTAVGISQVPMPINPPERLEVQGNVKLFGDGHGVIFPDGSKLTRALSGEWNTGLGVNALRSMTGGSVGAIQNTAVGVAALEDNTAADANTAVGYRALASNAEYSFNSAFGALALSAHVTGQWNTALGADALRVNVTGHSNTAVGYNAMPFTTDGNRNTVIGVSAGALLHTGSNNIYLGADGDDESDTIRIGRPSGSDDHTRAFIAGVRGKTTGSANAMPVLIDSHGQLGTASSSRRYKEDIHDMGAVSAALMRLRPVTFRYAQAYADGSKPLDYGLVAEEVAEVYPDLVVHDAQGRVESVQYHKLTPLLLNEVQRQHRRVAELEGQIAELGRELAALAAPDRRRRR